MRHLNHFHLAEYEYFKEANKDQVAKAKAIQDVERTTTQQPGATD